MPIHSRTNQYLGINAHLNSRLQGEFGTWGIFHSSHITDLARAIDAKLPPGYVVEPEKGLQIVEFHPDTGEAVRVRRRKPDLTIYDTDLAARRSGGALAATTAPTLTLSALEAIDENPELYYPALAIREVEVDGEIGRAVTWIELLSPTNKSSEPGFLQYSEKRISTLRSHVSLVEIDYLHETLSPIPTLPSYPDRERGAYPYTVVVTDPRPTLQEGRMNVYGFGVDEAMPVVPIPLAGEEAIALDFGAVYHQTFASLRSFSLRVDYEQLPDRFETYHEADQARIRARMAAVQEAVRRGLALEAGPFPLAVEEK